jgi:hypothetical protein
VGAKGVAVGVRFDGAEGGVEGGERRERFGDFLGCGRDIERSCGEGVAEEVWGGGLSGGVEAFEEEFVVFELGGFESAVVEDADDEIEDAVGGEGKGKEGEGWEIAEDGDEDLGSFVSICSARTDNKGLPQ